MPILGLGIHFLIAIFFAVHALRSGREIYWLLILFSFPILGSAVYFFAIFLPHTRLERELAKAGRTVLRSLDPGGDLREAQQAFDLTPTAHNQVRLAETMLAAGMSAQAVAQFEACLRGPFAKDPEIRFGAARARLANQDAALCIEMLTALRNDHPGFRGEQCGRLLAQAYAAAGRHGEAGREFAMLVQQFKGIETRAEYALWAIGQRDRSVAEVQLKEIEHHRKHMSRDTRSLYQELFKRLDAARAQLERR